MVAKLFTVPFAVNGDVAPVPDASQVDGSVSYDRGFGADYDRQLGVDPQAKSISRESWNSVQRDVTTALQEMQSGLGLPPFSLTFAAALPGAGYPRAAIVPRADGAGYWQNYNVGVSVVDPTTAGSGWLPLNVKGTFTQALTNVNVTLSSSNAAFPILILTGALTGNVVITLPNWASYDWIVDNRCTGAFTVTITVAAGVPVTAPNLAVTAIYCDGVNIKLGSTAAYATENVAGVAEIATQPETAAGADDSRIVTPLKLAQKLSSYIVQATEAVFGWAKVATQAQTNAGTDDETFVTPKKLRFGFAVSLVQNGYITLPSWLGGLIIQWGLTGEIPSNTEITVTLPISFPAAAHCVVVANQQATVVSGAWVSYIDTITTSNFVVGADDVASSSGTAIKTYWIAVGH